MKEDLFEFDFELRLSDGLVKQKKPTITLNKHTCSFYIYHMKTLNENAMLDEQELFLYKILFFEISKKSRYQIENTTWTFTFDNKFLQKLLSSRYFFNKKLLIVAEFEAMDISSGCKFLSVHFMFLTEKWKGRYYVRGRERLW